MLSVWILHQMKPKPIYWLLWKHPKSLLHRQVPQMKRMTLHLYIQKAHILLIRTSSAHALVLYVTQCLSWGVAVAEPTFSFLLREMWEKCCASFQMPDYKFNELLISFHWIWETLIIMLVYTRNTWNLEECFMHD